MTDARLPDPPRLQQGRVWIVLAAWSAGVCLLLGILDPFGALAAWTLVPAAGGAVAVVAFAAARWRTSPHAVLRFSMLFAALTLTLGGGRLAGRWGAFVIARPSMEREIQRRRDDPTATPPSGGVLVERPDGALRAAFVRAGVLDHWCGWVYDEQGTLPASVDAEGRVTGAAADWFGGRMVRAEHLTGRWWCCWFT